jgi:co-chaperonin GroES (HSP10)
MAREFNRIAIAPAPAQATATSRKAIEDVFADTLQDIDVYGPQLLVATYVRAAVTKGGIHLTDNYRREDEFQGKVGLVLAVGPTAFQDTATVDFGGRKAKVGDWVVYSPHDGLPMNLTKQHCRLIDDVQVRMVVKDPDIVM